MRKKGLTSPEYNQKRTINKVQKKKGGGEIGNGKISPKSNNICCTNMKIIKTEVQISRTRAKNDHQQSLKDQKKKDETFKKRRKRGLFSFHLSQKQKITKLGQYPETISWTKTEKLLSGAMNPN